MWCHFWMFKLKSFLKCRDTGLNRSSLRPVLVFAIDRLSVGTGQFNDVLQFGLRLIQDSVLVRVRFRCILKYIFSYKYCYDIVWHDPVSPKMCSIKQITQKSKLVVFIYLFIHFFFFYYLFYISFDYSTVVIILQYNKLTIYIKVNCLLHWHSGNRTVFQGYNYNLWFLIIDDVTWCRYIVHEIILKSSEWQ